MNEVKVIHEALSGVTERPTGCIMIPDVIYLFALTKLKKHKAPDLTGLIAEIQATRDIGIQWLIYAIVS